MFQIAYFSTAAEPQSAALIDAILVKSRLDNLRDDISGLLVAGGNRYLQVIEGRRQAVEALYGRIRADHRHLAVTTLVKRNVLVRCFDGWAMAYRREAGLAEFDSFPQVLGYLTDQVADLRLRGQIRQFAKSFIAQPVATAPELWRMAS
ncbi:MAG: BLUF domain-containing protein [Sphingomicrobium sp.]